MLFGSCSCRRAILPGESVVLEIGTGSGLLAMVRIVTVAIMSTLSAAVGRTVRREASCRDRGVQELGRAGTA